METSVGVRGTIIGNQRPGWLKEHFTKEETENYLRDSNKPINSFLIRGSTSALMPWLILSIKLVDTIRHYKVYVDQQGLFFLFEASKFENLEALVKKYLENDWDDVTKKKDGRKPSVAEKPIYDVIKKQCSPYATPISLKKQISTTSSANISKTPYDRDGNSTMNFCLDIKAQHKKVSSSEKVSVSRVKPVVFKKQTSDTFSTNSVETPHNEGLYLVPMQIKPVKTADDLCRKNFTRDECEEYLHSKPNNTYLLRPSGTRGNECLSMKTEKGVHHYVIFHYDSQYYIQAKRKFASIESLIENYTKSNWQDLLNSGENIQAATEKDPDSTNNGLYDKPGLPLKVSKQISQYDYTDHYRTLDMTKSCMKTFTRKEAEENLSKSSVYSYLIRPSDNGKSILSIKSEDGVVHFRIFENGCNYYIHEHATFPTISALVNSYLKNNLKDLLASTSTSDKPNESLSIKNFDSKEAEMYLTTKPYYSYVLRNNKNYLGCKALTVKTPEKVLHYIVYSSKLGFYIYKDETFDTIEELIKTYSDNQWERLYDITHIAKKGVVQHGLSNCARKMRAGKQFVVECLLRTYECISEKC